MDDRELIDELRATLESFCNAVVNLNLVDPENALHQEHHEDVAGIWVYAQRLLHQKIDPRAVIINLLCELLETEPDRLDPKDVMRYNRDAYDVLYLHEG